MADHRLGLAISFEGFVPQGGQVLAPLDIQMHVDGDSGDKFRVGTLGVGPNEQAAMKDAIAEWHLLAASPVLSALGASIEKRRSGGRQQLAGWDLFAGMPASGERFHPNCRPAAAFIEPCWVACTGWSATGRTRAGSRFAQSLCWPPATPRSAIFRVRWMVCWTTLCASGSPKCGPRRRKRAFISSCSCFARPILPEISASLPTSRD